MVTVGGTGMKRVKHADKVGVVLREMAVIGDVVAGEVGSPIFLTLACIYRQAFIASK